MKKAVVILLLLANCLMLSAQNTEVEKEALYYIKKAYDYFIEFDMESEQTSLENGLKYLKVFEEYLQTSLSPDIVGDSLAYYYGATISLMALFTEIIDESSYYQNAYKYLIKPAEKGLASAQYNIGWLYYNGRGVDKDYGEALKWFQKAADQGNVEALMSIGFMYLEGYGVKQDYVEAQKWLQKADELQWKKMQEVKP